MIPNRPARQSALQRLSPRTRTSDRLIWPAAASVAACVLLNACGGGGGEGSAAATGEPASPAAPSNLLAEQLPIRLAAKESPQRTAAEVAVGGTTLSSQRASSGNEELVLTDATGSYRILRGAAGGPVVIVDGMRRLVIVGTPVGTGMRFSVQKLENTPGTPVKTAIPGVSGEPRPTQVAALRAEGISCYGLMKGLTSSSIEAAEQASQALDRDGNPTEYRRAGRVAAFLAYVWREAPRFICPDAPARTAQEELQSEQLKQLLRAIGADGLQQVVDAYGTVQEMLDSMSARALRVVDETHRVRESHPGADPEELAEPRWTPGRLENESVLDEEPGKVAQEFLAGAEEFFGSGSPSAPAAPPAAPLPSPPAEAPVAPSPPPARPAPVTPPRPSPPLPPPPSTCSPGASICPGL